MELVQFNKAKKELQLATSIDEVKEVRDKAAALRLYAKQSGESLEMQNMCAEIKIRAERRGGEMFKSIEREQGKRTDSTLVQDEPKLKQTEKESGVATSTRKRWEKIADIPEEVFEIHIVETKEKKKELTSGSFLNLANTLNKQQKQQEIIENEPIIDKYRTIVIDPPWPVQKILREVRPLQGEFAYKTMTIEEIKEFEIPKEGDSCIFLWTTQKFLPVSFDILKDWGFRYVFTMVWHKNGGFQPFGLPQYNCEFVLFGRKGTIDFIDTKNFFACFNAERREHSRKPTEFYETINRVCPSPKIDIFAREKHDGFDQYGHEKGKFDDEMGKG